MEYYKNWLEEKRSAYLYGVIAKNQADVIHQQLFDDLRIAAEKQAKMWEKKMQTIGFALPVYSPDLRAIFIALLIKVFGAEKLHPILAAMKVRGMSLFTRHTEKKHMGLNMASNLRAAVFGVNDGLISNMSLILGVAGANADTHYIILTGVAGLLAGASSMGAGEYISVSSQKEVFEYQIAIEKEELIEYPEEEIEELKLIYQARGLPEKAAKELATLMINNPETALNTLAHEELGLNPEKLVSPIGAMLSSFFAFAVGAFIPVLPFFLIKQEHNLYVSIGLTAISLFVIGATLSLFTNKNPIYSGIRMLLIGSAAGMFTYLIGKIIGVSI